MDKEKIAKISIYGLNIKSIKTYVRLNKPLEGFIYYCRENKENSTFHCYDISGKSFLTMHYIRYTKYPLKGDIHKTIITDEIVDKELTNNGLAGFRTTAIEIA